MTSVASKKYIVWDWNGTIIADEIAVMKAANKALVFRQKAELDIESFREAYDMPLTKFYTNAGFTLEELEAHLPAMNGVFHQHLETFAPESILRDGWDEVAEYLKTADFSNIILSNHLVPLIQLDAERLGVAGYFQYILANKDQAEQLKKIPKSQRLHVHMQTHNLRPEDGIIIGDTPEEALIGRELGIASVLITGGYVSQKRLEEVRPDYLIHSLNELPPILKERGFVP